MDESQQSDNSLDLATIPNQAETPLMRASVIEVDLLMHSAIVGEVLPIVPTNDQWLALPPQPPVEVRVEPTWSLIVLNIHLRAVYRQNPLMLATPEIAA